MKNKFKIIAAICSAILFCSCSPDTKPAIVSNGTERAVLDIRENSTESLSNINDASVASETTAEANNALDMPDACVTDNVSADSDVFSRMTLDDKDGIVVEGIPLSPSNLISFEEYYEESGVYEFWNTSLKEYVMRLDNPEIGKLCERAFNLCANFSTDHLFGVYTDNFNVDTDRRNVMLDASACRGEYSCFEQTGISADSFSRAYRETFTEEALERAFENWDFFCFYNGQLWASSTSSSGDLSMTGYEEYELITSSEEEFLFRSIQYGRADILEHTGEYEEYIKFYPEKKDEYDIRTFDYRFVKTQNGWRVDEFPVWNYLRLDGSKAEYQ